MSSKLSKRLRYILKWNGPNCVTDLKRQRRHARANMGNGDETTRMVSTAYVCRFQGFYPSSDVELCRRAGVPYRVTFRTGRMSCKRPNVMRFPSNA